MADQKIEITNDSGSHVRVAFDLMQHIFIHAADSKGAKSSTDELIALYVRCRAATHGSDKNS